MYAMRGVATGLFFVVSIYLLLMHQVKMAYAAPGNPNNLETHRTRARTLARFPSRHISQYPRIKNDPFLGENFIADDEDLFELSKRQTSDDYGHMRFGKRGDESFDDYGHMRFGRNGDK